ncbi:NAD(+) synthase [Fluviicola taffensis]|uniref:NH(3)-dependent NAD(+) synthetase n=1 Tax=Fluviicola taffensis (strain DSM 16823 / NCIMB 13979 / RW262) TaxID=755732 RepID=F2IBE9_FLUTR|nr:NAD(+) synthase [Fluviicola taffensis]AEA44257.1 NAD+ synthetase [Fluviicola taffensis DSM 16823]
MEKELEVIDYISNWLKQYAVTAGVNGFVVGISGGVDSAVTSALCAKTGMKVLVLNMPIRQTKAEFTRATEHIDWLQTHFSNVEAQTIDLTDAFFQLEKIFPVQTVENHLAMANSRARLRMTTLYALGQTHGLLVAGTGNKIEDFGVGFFTKYGDGGVDLSPIADLTKTEVFELAGSLNIVPSILTAKPTDGLWEDGRSDEDQIGATYPELEWAMDFTGNPEILNERQKDVLEIFQKLNKANKHKMEPIPVCILPENSKW